MTRDELDAVLEANRRADLRGAALRGMNLEHVDFREADLREADLRDVQASHARFSGCLLTKADMRAGTFYAANFRDADLTEIDGRGANFAECNLRYADLSGARLDGSDMSYSDLSDANVGETDFGSVELEGARMSRRGGRKSSQTVDTPRLDFATGPDYPRSWMWGPKSHLDGTPILIAPNSDGSGGSFDVNMVQAMARFALVSPASGPFADVRHGDLIRLLRSFNPRQLFVYTQLYTLQFFQSSGYGGAIWAAFQACDADHGLLFCNNVAPTSPFPFEASGTTNWHNVPRIQQALIDLTKSLVIQSSNPQADGIFFDETDTTFNVSSDGAQHAGVGAPVDFARAGYASIPAMNAAADATMRAVWDALTPLGLVLGNGITLAATQQAKWSGCLFENWPFFQGGTTDSGLALLAPWAGAGIDGGGRALITTYNDSAYSGQWCRYGRLALGVASLCGGYGCVRPTGGAEFNNGAAPLPLGMSGLWTDEYSVTKAGVSDMTGANVGWLGRPIDLPLQQDGATGMWVRRFSRGIVLVNGAAEGGGGKTITLEKPYKRILGVNDPAVNNGATQQTVTVAAGDAAFMVTV